MAGMDLPLLEDDLDASGVIEPAEVVTEVDIPRCMVLCFFSEVIQQVAARDDTVLVTSRRWAHGPHSVYEIPHRGERLAVMHPGVGAPLTVGLLEEVIALGCRTIVAVGGAGGLVPELVLGHAVVVDSAVRDEGTSFHYLAPSRTVDADPLAVAALEDTLRDAGVPFVTGRTWTTDAPYRETRARVERRVAEGCLTVEMEAAAFIAATRYRQVRFGQLLYAGDSLAGPVWEQRGWTRATSVRDQLFWLAADACLRLDAG
jgi:uridine phosphorylase